MASPVNQLPNDPQPLNAALFDPRRVPESLNQASQDQSIRDEIQRLMDANGINPDAGGVSVLIKRNGVDIFELNEDQSMTPASALKIVTGAAAIELLGKDTRFETTVQAVQPDSRGTINGNLHLVGGGDPLLFNDAYNTALRREVPHSSLDALAAQIAAKGVKRIQGNIVGVDTRFDDQRFIPTWSQSYTISGQVGAISALNANQGFVRYIGGRFPAQDPTVLSADLFRLALAKQGVVTTGYALGGPLADDVETLASVNSATVEEAVNQMLMYSDNTTAEVLLKNIGVVKRKQGTTQAGLVEVATFVNNTTQQGNEFHAVDGSGLDRQNRASCSLLDSLLESPKTGNSIRNGLPTAGESGTLEDRMRNSPAAGKIHAKTGTLADVSSLVGWANTSNNESVRFCVITNGFGQMQARNFEEGIAAAIAQPDQISANPTNQPADQPSPQPSAQAPVLQSDKQWFDAGIARTSK